MKVNLVMIDPQNDFCSPNGALYVLNAEKDMERLAKMIDRIGDKLDDIHVTLDSHRTMDIAHPLYWINSNGEHPKPFTIITMDEVKNGKWQPTVPSYRNRALNYVETLKVNGRYDLIIWPEHCLIGSWGHALYPDISKVLIQWEKQNIAVVDYITKGSNIHTEHYSAVQADVPDPTDPSTMLNTRLIDILMQSDLIPITGEALSHCVKFSVEDIANTFGDENIKKISSFRRLLFICCWIRKTRF
jgi:nicotinamidase/pyrazinamidase